MNTNTHYLAVQATYATLSVALGCNDTIRDRLCTEERSASAHLIRFIDQLLERHELALDDLSFIAVDSGPGAFTSLRVSIATLNAIAYGRNIPLVSVNGLQGVALSTLIKSQKSPQYILSLLNAYGGEVYAALFTCDHQKQLHTTIPDFVAPIATVLAQVEKVIGNEAYVCCGNGAKLLPAKHPHHTTNDCLQTIATASADAIGMLAYQEWQDSGVKQYAIQPYYIKEQKFTPKVYRQK